MKVNHKDVLEAALFEYSKEEPDITVICNDRKAVSTTKFLLAFYSPILQNILKTVEYQTSLYLYLPVSSGSVMNLLNILATGKAVSKDTHDLVQVNEIAQILGIQFHEWQLGSTSNDTLKKEQIDLSDISNDFGEEEDDLVSEPRIEFKETKLSIVKQQSNPLKLEENTDIEVNIKAKENKMAKNNLKSKPLCSKCGKTFGKKQVLEKHIARKVCDRKIAHDSKIRQIMQDAIEMVKT